MPQARLRMVLLTPEALWDVEMNAPNLPTGDAVFLLSFRQRGEVSAIAAAAGWRVVAGRHADDAAGQYLGSAAPLAVLDARGALAEGMTAAQALGDAVLAMGGALLVLVSHDDVGSLREFYTAGATHFLVSPFTDLELAHALKFAWRHVQRLASRETADCVHRWPGLRIVWKACSIRPRHGSGSTGGWHAANRRALS